MRVFLAGIVISIVVLAIGIWLAAGGLSGSASSLPDSATIVLEDYRFNPNRLDAKVGQSLTVILTNAGTVRHDLNFPSIHMPGLEGVESMLEPGETRTIVLSFDQPGSHVFSCSLPGHASLGMTGAVFVQP